MIARNCLRQLRGRLESFLQFPYVGKVNAVYGREDVRETVVEGFKVIYQIAEGDVIVLAIYKNIDFDEAQLEMQQAVAHPASARWDGALPRTLLHCRACP